MLPETTDDVRQTPSLNTRALTMAALIGVFLGLDFLLAFALKQRWGETSLTCLAGALVSQLNLIALWAVFAPAPAVRFFGSIGLAAFAWFASVLGAHVFSTPGNADLPAELLVVIIAFVAVAMLPLWIARWLRFRLLAAKVPPLEHWRFSLRHSLIGLTLICVLLGIARWILDTDAARMTLAEPLLLFAYAAVPAVANQVLAFPVIWFTLWTPPKRIPFALVGIGAYAAFVAWLGALVFILGLGGMPGATMIRVFVYLLPFIASQCVALFTALILLRIVGFRLQQISKAPTAAAPAPSNGGLRNP